MIIRYQVSDNLPAPARTAVNVVQAALKVHRSVAEKLIHEGAVRCGGRNVAQSHLRLQVGDELEIDYAPQPIKQVGKGSKPKAQFEVVHDDESIIVVVKPAGLLTVPTPKREGNTLQSQLRKWVQRQQPDAIPCCVHRLDRGVSGLLVFAKSPAIAEKLREQFAARKPKRKYVAILQGKLTGSGTFETYLSTDESLNRYSVSHPDQGELAITHYQVKENWDSVTLVEVQLETGRRNQIRVHFAEAGHPLLGDPRYKPREAQHPLWPSYRIALHAESLGFTHPESGEAMAFRAPWPQEFRDLRRRLKHS